MQSRSFIWIGVLSARRSGVSFPGFGAMVCSPTRQYCSVGLALWWGCGSVYLMRVLSQAPASCRQQQAEQAGAASKAAQWPRPCGATTRR
jgi:hypothetical protein